MPLGVVYPKSPEDIQKVVRFANKNEISIIPRTAGTSLAGQCVGDGLVVDVSRYLTRIIGFDEETGIVEVEPGVVRDELNNYLRPMGRWFSPNTSTSNRCMIGGMVGNNSCGTTSIKYGTTRDKFIGAEIVLSDGSMMQIGRDGSNSTSEFWETINQRMEELISSEKLRSAIRESRPKPDIHRRNTGYNLESLIDASGDDNLNLLPLIAGSEGTLCFLSKIRLQTDPLPPPKEAILCAHFRSMRGAMDATRLIMNHQPYACELMDKKILDLAKGNKMQEENSFFVEGDPEAILAVELRAETQEALQAEITKVKSELEVVEACFAFPVVYPPRTQSVWALRAAGLGVLSNFPGDAKPVAFVEDTAVSLEDLPDYISEFEELMSRNNQQAVYYAHAGAGELHLRPVLNLKTKQGQADFRKIGSESADLVKKYKGSLSGEHGDGIVRAEFIEKMVGPVVYEAFKEVKDIWDPTKIFNHRKIVDAYPMDRDFRYESEQKAFDYKTRFNWGKENMLQSAERCNGSGDCRKNAWTGATMCPSYQATRNEAHSTRARANVLRELMTRPKDETSPFSAEEIKESLDLCLSCKACKTECPSSVDMAALKAEAMFHFYSEKGFDLRTKFFGKFDAYARWASISPGLSNALLKNPKIERIFKKKLKIAPERSLPKFNKKRASRIPNPSQKSDSELVLYIDEFSEFQDGEIVRAAVELLQRLGYKFAMVYAPSGRAAFSKSMLKHAEKSAEKVLDELRSYLEKGLPIVGVEPSAVLGFRDEYLKLRLNRDEEIQKLAKQAFTIEEFLFSQMEKGQLNSELFHSDRAEVHIHLHCHQKALSHMKYSKSVLSLPVNYKVRLIPSGCCGMAGSFGYEEEHYQVSQEIGELVLMPHIRENAQAIIAAAGTSCRHQIKDGTGKTALHPVEILRNALK
jgi:FAD/FMN-containing dehydrogenase/Fe-S oxidoreductase